MKYILVLMILLMVGCIWDNPPKPEQNDKEYITTTVDKSTYDTWGSYATLAKQLQSIFWRIALLALSIAALTFALQKYIAIPIIPKMLISVVAGIALLLLRYALSWIIDFHVGEAILDTILAVVVANWGYKGIIKKSLFKRD